MSIILLWNIVPLMSIIPLINKVPLVCIITLMNKTSFADLVEIGRGAELILGGDTGPMHILSYLTKPMIMFFSAKSLFELVAPKSDNITLIRKKDLNDLSAEEVISHIN